MGVLRENSIEDGFLGHLGSYDYAMYHYSFLFDYGEW